MGRGIYSRLGHTNMMQKDKILDDVARVAGGTVGVLSDLGRNAKEDIRTRVEEIADRLDLVPRDEFDRLEVMLKQSRTEQDELKKRIEELEKKIK